MTSPRSGPTREGEESQSYPNMKNIASSQNEGSLNLYPCLENMNLGTPPGSRRSNVTNKSGGDTGMATPSTAPLSPLTARRLQLGPRVEEMTTQLATATSGAGKVLAAGVRNLTAQGTKTLMEPMEKSKFGWLDALMALFSIGLFYFDVVSDIFVAYYMYDDPETEVWFRSTVLFLVIPLLVVNAFSIYWYWFDEHVCESEEMCYMLPKASPCVWGIRIITHLLLQGTVLRYIDLLYSGIQTKRKESSVANHDYRCNGNHQTNSCAQKNQVEDHTARTNGNSSINPAPTIEPLCNSYHSRWIHAERDAANVDVLSSMLQDAPQLILQLYIMTHTIPDQALQGHISQTLMMQILSVTASVVAMALSVGAFSKAIRLAHPSLGNLSLAGLLFLSISHFCSIAPQVLCFALFASKYLIVFLALVSCHWLASSVFILIQLVCSPDPRLMGTTFSHDIKRGPCNRLDDIAFSAVFGLILLYTFMNVGGRAPKIQFGVYHFFRLVEEACMLAFWYLATDGDMWYHWLPLVLVSLSCVLGIIFFSLYYCCVNPDRDRRYLSV
ncbi:XK-related protein 7-like isoform X2 [Homarus americanus]|uniref:XK-related protein 7-like isoform X2 n=1 Tax=Homarus americanus TaxID=6706 RepID=UPI001C4682D1|nr:XK-related protein 7-like isoform X2 [Homarus americanus]